MVDKIENRNLFLRNIPAFANIFILSLLNSLMFESTKIKKVIDTEDFIKLIQNYSQE